MKKAFTMIELVFVIVVIGILAAVIIPSTKTNPLQEAAIQVLSHIRYTQHLAMVDDKYDANDPFWYRGRWQLIFYNGNNSNNVPAYTVYSDNSGYTGDPSSGEIAMNPQNKSKLMTGGYSGSNVLDIMHASFNGTKSMNLGMKYGITSYQLSGGCNGARISFDHLGRPITGDLSSMTGPYFAGTQRLVTTDCNITLADSADNIIITIRPETGYSSISFN
ncbi:MAG: type II secretion system protein [Sulfurimonas sp.]